MVEVSEDSDDLDDCSDTFLGLYALALLYARYCRQGVWMRGRLGEANIAIKLMGTA